MVSASTRSARLEVAAPSHGRCVALCDWALARRADHVDNARGRVVLPAQKASSNAQGGTVAAGSAVRRRSLGRRFRCAPRMKPAFQGLRPRLPYQHRLIRVRRFRICASFSSTRSRRARST